MKKIEEGGWELLFRRCDSIFHHFYFVILSTFFLLSCTEDFEPRADFVNLASPYGILLVDADTQ